MRHQTVSLLYTGTAAILAVALSSDEPLLFLATFCVIIPTYLIVVNLAHDIVKVGAYLQVFHEGDRYQWETHNSAFNADVKSAKNSIWKRSDISRPFLILGAAALTLFLMRIDQGRVGAPLFIAELALAAVCASCVLVIRAFMQGNIYELKLPYIQRWSMIKERSYDKQ